MARRAPHADPAAPRNPHCADDRTSGAGMTSTGDDTAVREGHVISRDGTRIGVLRRGHGPGLVLVQGAMATAVQFGELAEALAADFTVLTPDRRGRGRSPRPYDSTHDIARDVEDVDAVLAAAGASHVFGLSSGAVIALEAARTLPRVTAAAVYEPPFYAPGRFDHDGVRQLHVEIEQGRPGAALVTSLETSGTAPGLLRRLPRPAARLLARCVLALDARVPGDESPLRELLPGSRYDFHVVAEMDGRRHTLATLDRPTLVLSGTASPAFLRQSSRELAAALPHARHVELDGLGHSGPWNVRRGGRPEQVAPALRRFFTSHPE